MVYVIDLDDTLVLTKNLNNDAYNFALEQNGQKRIKTAKRLTRENLNASHSKKLIIDKQNYFAQKWLKYRVVVNEEILSILQNQNRKDCYLWTSADKNRADYILKELDLYKYFNKVIYDDKKDLNSSLKRLKDITKSNVFLIFEDNEKFFKKTISWERVESDKFKVKEGKCTVIIIEQEKGDSEDVVSIASNYVESENDCVFSYDGKRTVLIKFVSDNKEYRSIIEYAEFLSQTIYEETGINVKIAIGGTVKRFTDLEKSFLQALSVFSMEKTVSLNGSVRSFREFVIVKALDELPSAKKEEYLNLLFDDCNKEIFSDEVLCATAEEFFESNLNVSLASRKTFLHRNTLTYRLDKIQRETGLDLRRYNDAVTFRLITVLNKLLDK